MMDLGELDEDAPVVNLDRIFDLYDDEKYSEEEQYEPELWDLDDNSYEELLESFGFS